jgi:two-component sensor histidine kinase
VKNTLATVQAMAMLTGRSAPTKEAYRENLEARIMSLSKTHQPPHRRRLGDRGPLRDLLRTELEPYDDGSGAAASSWRGQTSPSRPALGRSLGPRGPRARHQRREIRRALHTPEGAVRVAWEVTSDGAVNHLEIVWKETGGPAVTQPTRKGFGSRLLLQGLARDLDGETHLDFAADGVSCRLRLPLSEGDDQAGRPAGAQARTDPAIAASL